MKKFKVFCSVEVNPDYFFLLEDKVQNSYEVWANNKSDAKIVIREILEVEKREFRIVSYEILSIEKF